MEPIRTHEKAAPMLETEDTPPIQPSETARRAIHISGYHRENRDFYATPAWVTQALLRHIRLRDAVWEPCCGDGAMAKVIAAAGHQVVSTDITDRGFGQAGIDFLSCHTMPAGCQAIVTNPPYGDTGSHIGQSRSARRMLDFVAHAMDLAATVEGQLALLVRLNWIAGQRATKLLSSGPFAATIVLNERIRWFDMGEKTNHGQHHHAWIVIDHQHPKGQPPALLFA